MSSFDVESALTAGADPSTVSKHGQLTIVHTRYEYYRTAALYSGSAYLKAELKAAYSNGLSCCQWENSPWLRFRAARFWGGGSIVVAENR